MSEVYKIVAQSRSRAGKGVSRALRREGFVPGVIYGGKKKPQPISVDRRLIFKGLERGNFLSMVCDVEVDGKTERCLPREVQLHPVSDFPMHVDFLRVTAKSTVEIMVPVDFQNEEESPGLKRGGVLNIVRHEVELSCPADSIPEHIVVDLAGTDIGDSIHISQVDLPKGAKPTITDRDFTIVTIAAPSGMSESTGSEEEEEAEEEGEE